MRAFAIVAAAACFLLTGCGGEPDRAEEPLLPAAVGENLAGHAAAVAERLEAGDTCGAAHEADRLNEALRRAIADGDVPDALRAKIQQPVQRLVNEVNCEEPPPSEEEEEGSASCDELEAQKQQLDEEKEGLKDTIEDEEERKQREQEIEEEKKRVEDQLKECDEDKDD